SGSTGANARPAVPAPWPAWMRKNTDVEQGDRAFRQVYTEEVCRDGQVSFRFHSDSCIHCRVPACVTACEPGCLYKDTESGLGTFMIQQSATAAAAA
ncbi:MAG: hypothetical protein V8Q40_00400, partial [Anaerosacchariphilus sp.]